MTPEGARQAEANREDGWPYPDDDSDLRASITEDLYDGIPDYLAADQEYEAWLSHKPISEF
jgi:hypothetical protein